MTFNGFTPERVLKVQYFSDRESADVSVQEMVFSWVEQMIDYCKLIPRLMSDQVTHPSEVTSLHKLRLASIRPAMTPLLPLSYTYILRSIFLILL